MAYRARTLLLSISVATALVLALAIATRLVLPGWIRGRVERLAHDATGRALTIGGPLELSLFGSPTLVVGDVAFANAPGGSEPSMVRVGRLAVSLDLRAILSREVHLRRVEVDDVRVLLERDREGRPNWRLEHPERTPAAKKTEPPKVVVDDVVLRGVRLAYRPGGALKPIDFGIESFSARRDGATDMVAVDGRGDFNAEPWHLAGTVGTVARIVEGRDVDQALTGGIGNATLSVTGHLRDPLTLGGPSLHLDVAGPDVAAALAVFGLGSPLTGPFKIEGRLSPRGDEVGVDLVAGVGGIEAKAGGTVDALLAPARAAALVEASGPDATVIGGWTRVRGLPAGPFRAGGALRWKDRTLALDGVDVTAGGIEARVEGSIVPTVDLGVAARGRDVAVLSTLTTLRLPSSPFTLNGRFWRRGRVLGIDATELRLRDTTIRASGTIGTPPTCPDLDLAAEGQGPDASILSGIATIALPAERFDVRGRVAREGPAVGLHRVDGHLGDTAFGFDGALVPGRRLAGSRAHVHAGGEDLARALAPFGVHGLPAQPFDAAGDVAISDGRYDLDGVVAHVGAMDATVDGHVSAPSVSAATSLRAKLSGNRLTDLAAWGVRYRLPDDAFEAEGTLHVDGGSYRLEQVSGTIADDRFTADGTVAPDYDLDLRASGPRLAAIARFFEAETPPRLPEAPFDLRAHARRAEGGIALSEAQGTVGNAHLEVEGTLGTTTDAALAIEAPDTSIVSELADLRLPEGALRVRGRIQRTNGVVRLDGVKLDIGPAYAEVSGTLGALPSLAGTSLDVVVEGPDLAAVVGPLTGLSPLPSDSFAAEGHFEGDRQRIASDRFAARLGDSDAAGSIALGLGPTTTIDAKLESKRLDVARLVSGFTKAADEEAPLAHSKKTQVIPDAPIALTALRRLETHLDVHAGEVAFPGVPLSDVTIEGGAREGGLHIERFEGTGRNGGRLSAHVALEPDGESYRLDGGGRLDGGRFTFLQKGDSMKSAPTLDVEIDLTGRGRTLHEILASANGKALAQLGPGRIPNSVTGTLSSGFLLSLLDTLNPFRKESPDTPLECGIAAAAIENGKVAVEPIATRTDKLTVLGHGKLDLSTEEIDLTWTLKPRRGVGISAGTIVNPFIKLGGTLAHPKLDAKPLEAAASTGAAVATAGITILLKGFYDRITAETNVCAKALKKARKQEEERAKSAAPTAPAAGGE